ncbi:MAG TPA: metal-sensitive transcriptional regulator [Polyangiaceae bacterium]
MARSPQQPKAVSRPQSARGAAKHGGQRHAVGVSPALKESNLKRLRRIEGQVRGLHKMVEEDRYCPDILMQVASVQEALKSVSRELVRNHLSHCARRALSGSDAEAEQAVNELLVVWSRHAG